jgi:hypothetical protein
MKPDFAMGAVPKRVGMAGCAVTLTIWMLWSISAFNTIHREPMQLKEPLASLSDRTVVLGALAKEDTSWVDRLPIEWNHAVYIVDDPNAALHTPKNKGHEAMPYLTFIIDNYYSLSSTTAFVHSHRTSHHNDGPDSDIVKMLQTLRVDFIQRTGFANLRCSWKTGCPGEIIPGSPEPTSEFISGHMTDSYRQLLNVTTVPGVIASACCAQFAVSRAQIRKRPLSDYVHFRKWVMEAPIEDRMAGLVMEYLWHIIFGKEAVHCPRAEQCACDLYGKDCSVPGIIPG